MTCPSAEQLPIWLFRLTLFSAMFPGFWFTWWAISEKGLNRRVTPADAVYLIFFWLLCTPCVVYLQVCLEQRPKQETHVPD